MLKNYKCNRCCIFETQFYGDIKKHCNRKNPCKKINNKILYSDDYLLVLSLIPIHNNIEELSVNDIKHLETSNIIYNNKKELFEELDNIEKNKLKNCKYCNKEFEFIMDLKKHIIVNCFYNKLEGKRLNNEYIRTNSDINNSYNQCENISTQNNITNNTTNNIININLEIKNPIPFDNNWDISKINNELKTDLIFSKVMYTSLLEEILKNEINLNVIIDNDQDSGIVYKNDIDKYIQMKSKDIVENTMNKLNKQLLHFNKENTKSFEEIIDFSRKMINKKYIDFQKDNNIQENVKNKICSIFNNKKYKAINVAKKIINETDIKNIGY
jgi:hypothetical protein